LSGSPPPPLSISRWACPALLRRRRTMAASQHFHPIEGRATAPIRGLVNARFGDFPSVREWLWFALQLLAIAALQLGDDIIRGNIDPPNVHEAIRHAQEIVHLEQAHGFFVEPAWLLWLRHAHALFGLLSYDFMMHVADVVYALGQTLVPLLLVLWLFLRHRSHFPRVRNVAFLSTLLALVGYELYPTAPPRLTPGLVYHHHLFHFPNTVQQVIGDGKLNGIPVGYNAYSAMPSLHIAWALIVAGSIVLLAHHRLVRLLAGLYPLLMLFTVVVSANHYLLDAAGGALAAALATMLALLFDAGGLYLRRPRRTSTHLRFPAVTPTQPVPVRAWREPPLPHECTSMR
jgi:membrane-associated phospholipid phosphatase